MLCVNKFAPTHRVSVCIGDASCRWHAVFWREKGCGCVFIFSQPAGFYFAFGRVVTRNEPVQLFIKA